MFKKVIEHGANGMIIFEIHSACQSLLSLSLHLFLCVTLSVSSNPSRLGCPQNLEPACPWSQAQQGPDSPTDQALSAAWLRTRNPRGPRSGIWTQPELVGMLDGGGPVGARTLSVTRNCLVLTQAASPPLRINSTAGTLDKRQRRPANVCSWPRPFPSLLPTPPPWPRASPHIEAASWEWFQPHFLGLNHPEAPGPPVSAPYLLPGFPGGSSS